MTTAPPFTAVPALALQGRVALVTGASSGMGAHFGATLAAAGAKVVLAARQVERLQSVVTALQAQGAIVHGVKADVTDAASVRALLHDAQAWAGAPVDAVVNNAGVAVTGSALELTEDEWDRVLDTNLKGAWLVATEAARRMVAAGCEGSIVNVASILGERVAGAVSPYCASKAGLLHLTRALALEWARHGIRVNALAPGYVRTELNADFLTSEAGERLRQRVPQRRFGQMQDLDAPLLLLLGDAGRYITGAVLPVDGGHLVSGL